MITPIIASVIAITGGSYASPFRTLGTVSTVATISRIPAVELTVLINDSPAAEGATVAGEVKFTVKVVANNPVNNVEFYVGDDIRDTDGSTPYEFKVDTLSEKDGPLKVSFIAYTAEGEQGKKSLTVSVDNGTSKGVEWNVEQGNEMLALSKWDDAIRFGRVALKIDSNHKGAKLMMARAYRGKGVLDQAQKFAEDALTIDANYLEAADLLSVINLERAFATFNRGGDRNETLGIIRVALKQAVESRRKVLDSMLDRMGSPTDANRMAYADLAIRAGRYSAAISALSGSIRKDPANSALANRLAYAQIRAGRLADAQATLNENARANATDAFGYALTAILATYRGDDAAADAAMREAILSEPDNVGVQTAQAYIALKKGRMSVLGSLAANLAKNEGQRSEVHYYLATLYNATQRYVEGRKAFERAVLAEPTNYDMYVQRGNEALAIVALGSVDDAERKYQVQVARTFYDTALIAKPESAEALSAIALTDILIGNNAEAASFARAAVQASPGYAPAHFTKAMVDSVMEADLKARAERIRNSATGGIPTAEQRAEIARLTNEANAYGKSAADAMNLAMKLDAANLSGRKIPTSMEVFSYFMRHFRMPLLSVPK